MPVLQKTKEAYLLWVGYYQTLPKTHRYSLGQRIDTFFIRIIEALAVASFSSKNEKLPYISLALKKIDALKVLLMVLWETNSLNNKKYIALSLKIDEIGRMVGGWKGQLNKQNSPHNRGEK